MCVSRVGELVVPGSKYRRQGEREGDENIQHRSTGYLLTWLLVTRTTQGKKRI